MFYDGETFPHEGQADAGLPMSCLNYPKNGGMAGKQKQIKIF